MARYRAKVIRMEGTAVLECSCGKRFRMLMKGGSCPGCHSSYWVQGQEGEDFWFITPDGTENIKDWYPLGEEVK